MSVPSAASDAVLAVDHPSHDDGGPCDGCAFRSGSEASRAPHTTELARLCVEGFRPFYCHERPGLCRGFVAAMNLRGVPQDEDDLRWSIVAGDAADIIGRCIELAKAADAVDPSAADSGKTATRDLSSSSVSDAAAKAALEATA